jgi:hypothetical protein
MTFTKETIASILANPQASTGGKENRYLVYRMLQAMYQRQTASEQATFTTHYVNHVGFNSADAPLLTDVAKRSQKYNNLTPKQAVMIARRLKKYVGQLASIAAEKQQVSMGLQETPV